MKIRLWGTKAECRAAAEALLRTPGLTVVSISEPRADRGASVLVRVYVETRLNPPPSTQHASATGADRARQPGERAAALEQRTPRRRSLPPGGTR